MKKILIYTAAMIAVSSCNKTAFDQSNLEIEGQKVLVNVSAEKTESTRVSYDKDWITTWDKEDALLAIDMDGNIDKFTMNSYDASNPTFSGNALPYSYNLIYPYPNAIDIASSTKFDIDLTTQRAGAKHTYMISEKMIGSGESEPATKMKHLGATMVLDMKLTGYDGYTIESLEISGLNSKGALNTNYEYGSQEQFTDLTANTITITDKETNIGGNEAYVKVRFNILPTTIEANGSVKVNVYLKNSDGTTATLIKTIRNNTAKAIEFDRAMYHTLKCGLSSVNEVNYETKWTDFNYTDVSFAGGDGSSENPYQIATTAQLAKLTKEISAYKTDHFKLTNNIDISGHEWVAIGNSAYKFQGTLDGDGYKITGLYINEPEIYQQGIFGYIEGATIKNLSTSGSITASNNVGGIAGLAVSSTVINCHNNCSVMATEAFANVGGVVGDALGETIITNCYNSGSIVGIAESNIGGIVGYALEKSSVTNSYNSGSIKGGIQAKIGGVAGLNESSSITKCYWDNTTLKFGVGSGSQSGVEGKSTTEMKAAPFIEELNKNVYNYNHEASKTNKACEWIAGANGYPTLNFDRIL